MCPILSNRLPNTETDDNYFNGMEIRGKEYFDLLEITIKTELTRNLPLAVLANYSK